MSAEPTAPPDRPVGPVRRAALLLALACCLFGAVQYARASADPALDRARTRDAVLAAGRTALDRLTSAEAGQAEATRRSWLAVSGGALHDRLAAGPARDPGVTAHGSVAEAAVTALDTRAGTARLIALVRVDLVQGAGAVTTDRRRLQAELGRTADGWKVTALTTVPTGTA
ncbi:hypothetical protein AB0D08_16460 [Kitasatospora sp. NPDC048540]|uniref:hypothetical protein n=1 Tax=Kitasatospora sp. NPDC048540 TaxID=3155634 RepID=UPI0033F89411